MRIALFSVTYDPFVGGAEVAIKEITKRLGREFAFDLFTARLDASLAAQEKIGGVNVYRLGSGRPFLDKALYPLRAARLALAKHKQNPYHIIHAVMATYAGLAALLFKKNEKGIPYVLTLQSGDSDLFIWLRTWFWRSWYRRIYTKADKIIAISSWLAERARKYGYKGDVKIIPNGVDIEKFDIEVSDADRAAVRKSWGADLDDFVLITVSRLVSKNGIDILIDSMGNLPSGVKLVIAGGGKDERKLKNRAKKFGDRIIFLGNVEHGKIPVLLKSADMFARPSRSEGMGNSFVEAKAAGLPVLGTKAGGIKDLVKKGIVEPTDKNPESVADKIKHIKGESNIYNQTRDSGKENAKEIFNWDNIARKYREEYKKLLS